MIHIIHRTHYIQYILHTFNCSRFTYTLSQSREIYSVFSSNFEVIASGLQENIKLLQANVSNRFKSSTTQWWVTHAMWWSVILMTRLESMHMFNDSLTDISHWRQIRTVFIKRPNLKIVLQIPKIMNKIPPQSTIMPPPPGSKHVVGPRTSY